MTLVDCYGFLPWASSRRFWRNDPCRPVRSFALSKLWIHIYSKKNESGKPVWANRVCTYIKNKTNDPGRLVWGLPWAKCVVRTYSKKNEPGRFVYVRLSWAIYVDLLRGMTLVGRYGLFLEQTVDVHRFLKRLVWVFAECRCLQDTLKTHTHTHTKKTKNKQKTKNNQLKTVEFEGTYVSDHFWRKTTCYHENLFTKGHKNLPICQILPEQIVFSSHLLKLCLKVVKKRGYVTMHTG